MSDSQQVTKNSIHPSNNKKLIFVMLGVGLIWVIFNLLLTFYLFFLDESGPNGQGLGLIGLLASIGQNLVYFLIVFIMSFFLAKKYWYLPLIGMVFSILLPVIFVAFFY